MTVKRAFARRIEVQLSWRDLLGQPLLIIVDGIYVLAEASKQSTPRQYLDRQLGATEAEVAAAEAAAKQAQGREHETSAKEGVPTLDPASSSASSSGSNSGSKPTPVPEPNKGFHWLVTAAVGRVARAVKVDVRNIHIRLESQTAAPTHPGAPSAFPRHPPYSVGLILQRCTVDDLAPPDLVSGVSELASGVPAGASSITTAASGADVETGKYSFIRKRIAVAGLSVYCDSHNGFRISDDGLEGFLAEIQALSGGTAAGAAEITPTPAASALGAATPLSDASGDSATRQQVQQMAGPRQYLIAPLGCEIDVVVNDQGRPPPAELELLVRQSLADSSPDWEERLANAIPRNLPQAASIASFSAVPLSAVKSSLAYTGGRAAAEIEYERFVTDPLGHFCRLWHSHHVKVQKKAEAPEPAAVQAPQAGTPRGTAVPTVVAAAAAAELEGAKASFGEGTGQPPIAFGRTSRGGEGPRAYAPEPDREDVAAASLPQTPQLRDFTTPSTASFPTDGPVVGWCQRMAIASPTVLELARAFESAALKARPPMLDAALRLPAVKVKLTDVQFQDLMVVASQVGAYYAPVMSEDLASKDAQQAILSTLRLSAVAAGGTGAVASTSSSGGAGTPTDVRAVGANVEPDVSVAGGASSAAAEEARRVQCDQYRRVWRLALVAKSHPGSAEQEMSLRDKAVQLALERYWCAAG